MRLNKSIYNSSDKIVYYGHFKIYDVKLAPLLINKKNLKNVIFDIYEHDVDQTINLRHYVKTENVFLVGYMFLGPPYAAETKYTKVIYPPNIKELVVDDLAIRLDILPKSVSKLTIKHHKNIDYNTVKLGSCNNLTFLYIKDINIRKIPLQYFTNLKILVLKDIVIEKNNIEFPKNIKELYLLNVTPPFNKSISLKKYTNLEVFMFGCINKNRSYEPGFKLYDLPKSLNVLLLSNYVKLVTKPLSKRLLLSNSIYETEIPSVLTIFMTYNIIDMDEYVLLHIKHIPHSSCAKKLFYSKKSGDIYDTCNKLKEYYKMPDIVKEYFKSNC